MRHLKAGKKLNRNASHRRAMYRNMAMALIRHERIITTLAKAKAVRPFIEKLITLAKKAVNAEPERALHLRRLAISRLGSTANAELIPGDGADADDTKIVSKLFDELGPRFVERPGGYTRVIKRHEVRLGDAGKTAFLELLKEGEEKVRAHEPAAPAPAVEDEEEAEDEELEDQEEEQEDEEEKAEAGEGEEEDEGEEDEEDEDEEDEDEDEEQGEKKDEPKS